MLRILHRPKLATLAGVAAIVVAGIAYAYFTSSGGGSGTASVGTSVALVIHGTATSTLYPGTSSTVNFTVDNPGHGHEQLGTISLQSVKACTGGTNSTWDSTTSTCTGGGSEATGCETSDTSASSTVDNFSMSNVTSNQDIAPQTTGVTVSATGTLALNNLNSNQDACKNASLTLNFSS